MAQFDDSFAAAFPSHQAVFGESVTYTPAGGSPVVRTAVVDRDPPTWLRIEGVAQQAAVELANDATAGIVATAVDIGADRISFAVIPGGTAREWRVARILEATAATVRLLVK